MKKIAYIGNSIDAFNKIQMLKEYQCDFFIFQKDKVCLDKVKNFNCNIFSVSNKKELNETLLKIYKDIEFAIMYDFGVIVPKETLSLIRIFNFHPGNLRNNRGSSPINWSILLDEKKTTMTLYEITEEIDLGKIVCEHDVDIFKYDVPFSLRNRLEGEIPSMLLCLNNKINQNEEFLPIKHGYYRNRITEKDYTIFETDTEDTIKAKIRSQYSYKGAPLYCGNSHVFVKSYDEYLKMKKIIENQTNINEDFLGGGNKELN